MEAFEHIEIAPWYTPEQLKQMERDTKNAQLRAWFNEAIK